MSPKPRTDWDSLRAEYEAGASDAALSRKWGVSRTAIRKRRTKDEREGDTWRQDSETRIRRRTRSKLSGLDLARDPVTLEQAIDTEAAKRAAVIKGHRDLFERVRELVEEALALRKPKTTGRGKARATTGGVRDAFEAMKLAKITSETARNVMVGERLAYGIAEGEERPPGDLAEDDKALLDRWRAEYADGQPDK